MTYLRRLVLLVTAVSAMVAFVAPALAQAESFWNINGEKVGETPQYVEVQGHISYEGSASTIQCDLKGEVGLSNTKTQGEGNFTEIAASNCKNEYSTGMENHTCYTYSATPTAGTITALGGGEVELSEFGLSSLWEGCPVGESIEFEGTVDGTFNAETECLQFVKAGPLLTGTEGEFLASGSLCLSSSKGIITLGKAEYPSGGQWYVNGKKLALNHSKSVTVQESPWEFEFDSGYTISCENVGGHGLIRNSEGPARGQVQELDFQGCEWKSGAYSCNAEVSQVYTNAMSLANWGEGESKNVIWGEEVEVSVAAPGCLSESIPVAGNLVGEFNNTTGCLDWDETSSPSGLPLETPFGGLVKVTGQICLEAEGGGQVTLG